MHLFFFSALTLLLVYQDWRAAWPGACLIIGQHVWFAILQNAGAETNVFEGVVDFWKLFFHVGIALLHVSVCSVWSVRLRRDTLRQAWQQRQLEDARWKAKSATTARSAFLAAMSHEIRTPMNGVLSMLARLDESSLQAEQRQALDTARRSGEALLAIIDDLVDLSQLEAGRMEMEAVPFAPRRAIEDVAALFRPLASDKEVGLSLHVASGVPAALIGDDRRVRQILINLVGNALKSTAAGFVRIEATIGEGDGRLRIAVIDSGIGMDEDTIDRLFTDFSHAASSTTRRCDGTGLGLAISRRLAMLLGGDVTVESRPGHGSTLTLVLPAVAAEWVRRPAA
jgi:signal transduction histidine kinase